MDIAADATAAGQPWRLPGEAVLGELGSSPLDGLPAAEAAARLARLGPNELAARPPKPGWLRLAGQFANTMTAVLAVAAAVTIALGEFTDAVVIVAILVLNALLGFAQESRAERAVAALAAMTAPLVRVVRDGATLAVPAAEVVPGDLVVLGPGDVVAADLRLLRVSALLVDEAALTGESVPVAKDPAPLPGLEADLLAERRNMAFSGTTVTAGRGAGVVVATGMATELGRLAELLQAQPPGPTPLQRRLAALGRRMAAAAVAICAVVFAAGVARGLPLGEMFLTAVSLAVAAIPEGLPAVVTIALALGARRMARQLAVARRLPAVETLGSVTVICSDKTGTLTQNRMLAELVWTPAGSYRVGGDGYAPVGPVSGRDGADPGADAALARLAEVAAACNDAVLAAPGPAGAGWEVVGDPTEGALLALAGKLQVSREALELARPRTAELGFDAGRRRMTTLHQLGDRVWVASKGALEALVPLLRPEDGALAATAEAVATDWAAAGYRVLALAERHLEAIPGQLEVAERDLGLLGLVALADPARPESAEAIGACRSAGITPVMITGDDARTAAAIGRRIGLLGEAGTEPGGAARVLAGAELGRLDDDALAARVAGTSIYARTTPEQKLRIVAAWRRRGAVVAMTGDGVNDAPALRSADIGVAMGITGTDVSKQAADMVLADDNFATIVTAVREGRRIYDNIRRFVRYMLTTNSGEIWVMFLASVLGLPVPLLPVQILWVNLVTDGLPAVALGLEPAEPDTMRRPPRSPTESILAGGLWQQALWVGLLMAAVCLGLLAGARAAGWPWQTMVFTTLALLQLGNALAVRSERASLRSIGLGGNPFLLAAVLGSVGLQLALVYVRPLGRLFGTQPLTLAQLVTVLVASTAALVAVEAQKWAGRLRSGRPG